MVMNEIKKTQTDLHGSLAFQRPHLYKYFTHRYHPLTPNRPPFCWWVCPQWAARPRPDSRDCGTVRAPRQDCNPQAWRVSAPHPGLTVPPRPSTSPSPSPVWAG